MSGAESDDADAKSALAACSARVSLLRLRSSRSVENDRGASSRTTAAPRVVDPARSSSSSAFESGGMISPNCSRCSRIVDDLERRVLSKDRSTSRCARCPTSKMSGRLARFAWRPVRPALATRKGPRIVARPHGGRPADSPASRVRRCVRDATRPDRLVALVRERNPVRAHLERARHVADRHQRVDTAAIANSAPSQFMPCVTEREMALSRRVPTTVAPLDHAPSLQGAEADLSLDQIVNESDIR